MADYILSVTGAELENRLIRPLPVNQGGTGQTITRRSVEVTFDASVASAHSISVRYYPYLGMCYIRAVFTVAEQDVAANTWFTAATVDASMSPSYTTALDVSAVGGGHGIMSTDGTLRVAFETDQTTSQTRVVYVSGWWIVAQN